jgi:hypothetical protein
VPVNVSSAPSTAYVLRHLKLSQTPTSPLPNSIRPSLGDDAKDELQVVEKYLW